MAAPSESITETIRVCEMPCVPWAIDEAAILPQKGTWTIPPPALQTLRPDVQALLSCPNCGAVMPFKARAGDDIDRQHQTGVLTREAVTCVCGLVFTAKLLDWDRRRLYCVIYTRGAVGQGLSPNLEKEYLHAESREQAIWLFSQGHLDHAYHLVDAAPVFGYFAKDTPDNRDAAELSVD